MTEPICAWVRERLPRHVTGKLPAHEGETLEEHLPRCAGCREEARLIADLHAARPAPDGETRKEIRRAVLAGTAAPTQGPYRGGGPPRRRPYVAGGVAAAAVAALASLWLLPDNGPGTGEAPMTGDEVGEVVDDPVAEEWVVANDPILTELPEEALEHLLQELDE